MVIIGQKVRFDPLRDVSGFGAADVRGKFVTGTVVYVNYGHRWFSVEYGEHKQRISFNFPDIGNVVTICGK